MIEFCEKPKNLYYLRLFKVNCTSNILLKTSYSQKHGDHESLDSLCEEKSCQSFLIEDPKKEDKSLQNEREGISRFINYGICLCLLSKVFFLISISLVKHLFIKYEHISGYDYVLFRGGASILVALMEVKVSNTNVLKVPRKIMIAVIFRILAGGIGVPSMFIALKYLPTSQCHIIVSINPLIGSFLAYCLLSEAIHFRNAVFLLGAFCGCLVLATNKTDIEGSDNNDNFTLGVMLSLVALVFRSPSVVSMRHIAKNVNSTYSPFYFSVGLLINSVIFLMFFRDNFGFEYYNLEIMLLLGFSAVSNYFAQSLLSLASKYEKATVLAPFSYVTTCMILLIDLFLFHYKFKPIYFLGFGIILISVGGPYLYKLKK
ncbi:unnamed protein product [Moneuplotes crassus]|uniref:EamA domain-containing protein n=1 Tax=Euplotes crassus TaxID=5936 RepID=A0AAD1XDI2_EUPCR|nr:unnamed protein product [Moneuplotes crassus]